MSAAPGESVDVHVGTDPPANYRIEIYRLGWYQGLGGRLMTCQPSCSGDRTGAAQPTPSPDPTTGRLDAGWPVTDTFTVGGDWLSGYYEIKLLLTSGPNSGTSAAVPLIVRAPASDSATPILVQASTNTWEAYNNWGGKSLYGFNSTGGQAAVKVSFSRPYASPQQPPLEWEYQLVRFLERNGYDASYTTDLDTDQHPAELQRHVLVIDNGHDEYWTKAMRDAFEQARDAGTDLAFFGANISYWQTRFEDGGRTLVEYRSGTLDPSSDATLKTIPFRSLAAARPECTMLGAMYQGGAAGTGTGIDSAPVAGSLGNPWFDGTGFTSASVVRELVGYEWDGIAPGCNIAIAPGTGLIQLFHYQDPSGKNSDAVTYTAPSGARVFATGTMQWNWALDDWGHTNHGDPRIRRFTANMLDDLAGPPPPPDTWIETGPSGLTNKASVSFRFFTDSGIAFECSLDSGGWELCASPTSSRRVSDGQHTFSVRAKAITGTVDPTPATRSFTVDTTDPDTRITSGPAGLTNNHTQSFGFDSSEPGSTFECRIAAQDFSQCLSPQQLSDLSDGVHTFEVKATDPAANTDPTPATRSFTVDTTPPDTAITSGPAGSSSRRARIVSGGRSKRLQVSWRRLSVGAFGPALSTAVAHVRSTLDRTPRFSFTSSDKHARFSCRIGRQHWLPCSSPKTTAKLAFGRRVFLVRARDRAGNFDPSPARRVFIVRRVK